MDQPEAGRGGWEPEAGGAGSVQPILCRGSAPGDLLLGPGTATTSAVTMARDPTAQQVRCVTRCQTFSI